jgi:hypothetical protein
MKYWSVIVDGGGYILIGVCPGNTIEEAVANARIDFEEDASYWEDLEYSLTAITQKEYEKKAREGEAWAAAMAG